MCFFSPFSILSLCLGKRELVFMLIVHLFVSYAHVYLCHGFSSSWCRGVAAAYAYGSSWTFYLFWVVSFEGRMWDLIVVSVLDHCLYFYFPPDWQIQRNIVYWFLLNDLTRELFKKYISSSSEWLNDKSRFGCQLLSRHIKSAKREWYINQQLTDNPWFNTQQFTH